MTSLHRYNNNELPCSAIVVEFVVYGGYCDNPTVCVSIDLHRDRPRETQKAHASQTADPIPSERNHQGPFDGGGPHEGGPLQMALKRNDPWIFPGNLLEETKEGRSPDKESKQQQGHKHPSPAKVTLEMPKRDAHSAGSVQVYLLHMYIHMYIYIYILYLYLQVYI